MSVKAIVYKRDDGDYEPIFTVSVEHEELLEMLQENCSKVDFSIEHLDIVPDVIEAHYVEAKSIAKWDLQLNTQCPSCYESVDLLENPSFWKDRDLEFAGSANMQEVECPKCQHGFKCNIRNDNHGYRRFI